MYLSALLAVPVGVLPVLVFLSVLVYLDSFKLLRMKVIVCLLLAGGLTAVAGYFLNGHLLSMIRVDFLTYARYIAPVVEELLKASVLLYLFSRNRIGFLVDGAIQGFSVGAGFAVIENIYYSYAQADASLGIWIVRGFGTAIMHGGVTALVAIVAVVVMERKDSPPIYSFLPGLMLAIVIHSGFNHFFFSPLVFTVAIILLVPPVMYVVFERSTRSIHDWMELDFDADADLIQQLDSGEFGNTRVGRYLEQLRERFEGLVIVDMLCYLRLYTELSMRAKGVMMMRQHGLDLPADPAIEERFAELDYLENSIGRTGLLTLQPFLDTNRRDLWHLNNLKTASEGTVDMARGQQ